MPLEAAAPEDRRTPPAARLALSSVTKVYGTGSHGVVAVDGASFAVGDGEFLTIVGPSGCGKSTVLNIVAGLEQPTSGRILLDGDPIEDRRGRFGYMFQKDLLFAWRSIQQNVALGLEVRGVSRRESLARAGQMLERFGLAQFAQKYPAQLSGGMRQRVAFMRTLLCDRDILLLDEPFGALDAMTRSAMQTWLLNVWARDRRTILFITHDIEEAIYLSDRVLVMSARPGRIRDEIDIDLPRPRQHAIVTDPRFVNLKRRILDQLHIDETELAGA